MFAVGKWVMVKQAESEEKTAGGIIIPDKTRAKNAPSRGVVELSGVENNTVKKGDEILFSKINAFTDKIGDDTYVFIHQEDVIVVCNRDSDRKE